MMDSPDRTSLVASLVEPWAKNSSDVFMILARRRDASSVWPAILAAGRRNSETWGVALFLAVAHDAMIPELQRTPAELLVSDLEYDRNLGAEVITRMEASDDELRDLVHAVRQGRIKATSLRYAVMGRWAERRSAHAIADLIRATAAQKDGGAVALVIAHAAEANHGLSNEDLVQLLASTMFAVQGHDAWTWEEVGALAAKTSPESLGQALIARIAERSRDRANRRVHWAKDEVGHVIDRCVNAVPSLALRLLDLWGSAPDFIESLARSSLLNHIEPRVLGDWATDTDRQRSLAQIVVAAPHPTTEALLERFGAQSAFGSKLRDQLRPNSWSGSLAELLRSQATVVRTWADDPHKGIEFREWARGAATWLQEVAERAKLYD